MLFKENYANLEHRFQQQVLEDNTQFGCKSIYLPNIPPDGPVQYVLVAMEPSLGRWAKSLAAAQEKMDRGFKNFAYSIEDFILHFCIRQYLCQDNETYHITDISKGAMLVRDANSARQDRYDRWYSLLKDELDVITTPEAKVISIGKSVGCFLRRKDFCNHAGTILHYSSQAARYREVAVRCRAEEYREFASTVTSCDILRTAEAVLILQSHSNR